MTVTIYHNPQCSKSRATLALLRERGIAPHIVEYLNDPPDPATLKNLLAALGMRAIELVRTGEPAWRETGLDDGADETALLTALHQHPILIQRPIVVSGKRAIIGRPPENVNALFDA